ncbi:MAG TPA: serine hydrolase domain-containing protein [Bacteroidota bacterium]
MRFSRTILFALIVALLALPPAKASTPTGKNGFEKFGEAVSIIESAIEDSAFPGAQLAVIQKGKVIFNSSFGSQTYDENSPGIDDETIFDLASLTKVLATTSAVMRLIDLGKLRLDDRIAKYIPAFNEGEKQEITIRHILTHTSGMQPFRKLYDVCSTPEEALDTIYHSALVSKPGDSVIYSDLGMITLAKVAEKVSGKQLDAFVRDEFYTPLGMDNTRFNPLQEMRSYAAPTEIDTVWRMRLVQGTVHDERAELLGGVAGHAGLFSNATDISRFMLMLMNNGELDGKRCINETTVSLFTQRASNTGTRALGWDTRSEHGSSSGDLFSPTSYGHTGFTGTSIWVDPERSVCVILLTNRVYPTRANSKITGVRPALHNAIMNELVTN